MIAFGDRALRFAAPPDVRERRALLEALRGVAGVADAVVAEEQAMVVLDDGADRGAVERALGDLRFDAAELVTGDHVAPAVYDGEDLDEVARAVGLARSAVIDAHAGREYVVSFVGFMPGFAYLRGLDERLVLPRRARPRPRVPARSVGIAAKYTGIYPAASPGGWHLLARTAFDPRGRLALADRVRFAPVAAIADVPSPAAPRLTRGRDEIVSVNGHAVVVAPPHRGRMHTGEAPGGPLVAEAFARTGARRAIEVHGSLTVATARGALTVASSNDVRCAYLGIGDDAAEGTRVLRGDRIDAGAIAVPRPAAATTIAIAVGPDDVGAHVLDAVIAGTFRIAPASNRVGTRLEGPALPGAANTRADRASAPMIRGAIELTPSGLVVLGPDHPTTGGYPVIGVVRERAMDAFYTLPFSSNVRFAPA